MTQHNLHPKCLALSHRFVYFTKGNQVNVIYWSIIDLSLTKHAQKTIRNIHLHLRFDHSLPICILDWENLEPPALSTSNQLDISQLEDTTKVLKTSYLLPPMLQNLGKWLWALFLAGPVDLDRYLWEHDLSLGFHNFFSSERLSSANLLFSLKLCNVFVRWIGVAIFSWLSQDIHVCTYTNPFTRQCFLMEIQSSSQNSNATQGPSTDIITVLGRLRRRSSGGFSKPLMSTNSLAGWPRIEPKSLEV